MFPDYTNPTDQPHPHPVFLSTLLQEVNQFDYVGLRLDPIMTMKAAVESIQEKANTGHSLALAVSYSLYYDKHHSNPHPLQLASRNASTVETLCPPTLPTLPPIYFR